MGCQPTPQILTGENVVAANTAVHIFFSLIVAFGE